MMRKTILAGFFLLFASVCSNSTANAASRVWVGECGVLGNTNTADKAQICAIPFLVDSGPIDISGGTQSVTVSAQTRIIRVCAEQQTAIRGASGVTTSYSVLFALTCEYFGVQPSSTVSFILEP